MRSLESSNLFSDQGPDEGTEKAAVLLMVTSFLRHVDESEEGLPFTLPGFEQVVPHFWLTLARAAAATAMKMHRDNPEGGWELFDQALRWLDKALHDSLDPGLFYGAAQILREFGHLELARDQREAAKAGKAQKLFEEASDYLAEAARLGPARPDILGDLSRVLLVRSFCVDTDQRSTLREAIRRCDEALACFTETNRHFDDGGLHPCYTQLMSQAGVIRWLLAPKAHDLEEKRALLQEGFQWLRQAATEGGFDTPAALTMLGQTALELGWLPGSPPSRHEVFAEACDRFATVVAVDAANVLALREWGSALVGRAAVAGGDGQSKFLEEAEETFARAARLFPDESEPHLEATKIWLRLAGESSDVAKEGGLRAAAAARRANAIEPGSGDYLLACALSRLGQISDAVERLTSALARDPGQAAEALRDPHLDALWSARPELREQLAAEGSTAP